MRNRGTREFLRSALHRAGPRWLWALAGEVSGVWSIQPARRPIPGYPSSAGAFGIFKRMRGLFQAKRSPHPLFDPEFYRTSLANGKACRWPLLHFLVRGGPAGEKPHALFDPQWYLMKYPEVAAAGLNPLQHYLTYGWKEGRSPHPLFDPKWYMSRYPEARETGHDPLVHFLLWGGAEGFKPHPLFDAAWYLKKYPEVKRLGMNPLTHYVLHGVAEGTNPNPQFDTARHLASHPEAVKAGIDPLSYMLIGLYRRSLGLRPGEDRGRRKQRVPPAETLTLADHALKAANPPPVWTNQMESVDLPVLVVYGKSNVPFIESHLIPALAGQQGRFRLHLHTLHYKNSENLLSPRALARSSGNLSGVTDWSSSRPSRHVGFGEAVNYLFGKVRPENCFLIVNPDSLPMEGCVDQLLKTFSSKPAAFVEARQWPLEHPKEFAERTGETPWASGAFLLASSVAFEKLGGFDPLYFLYNEDVDLSWRAWLCGMPVVYEPAAMCAHFTGALSYKFHVFRHEEFFSIRNFLLIAYKFFGERGEKTADDWIRQANLPEPFYRAIKQSYLGVREQVTPVASDRAYHLEKIKILGMNLYHEVREPELVSS